MEFKDRLVEARKRTGLNQGAFGQIGGVSKTTQFNYENGTGSPSPEYWQLLHKAGVDINFILTGTPSMSALNQDEIRLLTLFREASIELKAAAIGTLSAGSNASTSKAKQIVHGNVGQIVEGHSHNAQINMGTKIIKKGKK